ncbi:histidinol-phosphate aminotransferase [Pseudobutyrivibrio sp. ACV-2]|uniref:pyridoxal phosphate-dependent aminotransferase n=1 Tax=Pseudobutyrivibrio sp. ACV-2 TaxID=1520801 RepID=UPI00089AE464|nr:histidinol-phosphate transaminase [Pseudobutyrivibrio sp. ACV-2]SEA58981.1 histidinol-phosphate aminotransferase [Pseudobutyrivibrio sp. ACV-2]
MHGGDIYRNSIQFDFSVNLNPLGVPQEVQWVLTEAVLHSNKYPDIVHENLIKDTAKLLDVDSGKIVYGNGASEIIMAICHSIMPKKALLVAPCFSGYETAILGATKDCQIVHYFLSEEDDFELHHRFIETMLVEKPDIVFLTNPNNPNGKLIDSLLLSDIVDACKNTKTTIVVDECFLPLTGKDKEQSLIYNIPNHCSLIVLRAFTKTFAIPGVRIGYAVCSKNTIADSIRRHLPEWNLSIFAQMAGAECIKHPAYINEAVKVIEEERRFLNRELKKLGLTVFTSDANFILFKCKEEDLNSKLIEYRILIRDCSDYIGLYKGFYRICVKQHSENEGLLEALKNLIY